MDLYKYKNKFLTAYNLWFCYSIFIFESSLSHMQALYLPMIFFFFFGGTSVIPKIPSSLSVLFVYEYAKMS